jgi:RNA polymerase sigma-70 factor (ECF subfamily)
VDHWRRQGREREGRERDAHQPADEPVDDWEVRLDQFTARATLARLGPHHRSALTLRYLDGLPVREVAAHLGRTEGATEVLLVRAKAAFRARYDNGMAP